MISNTSRKGSALLIVLGMLSFMVISAVSFSIFMRQSRAPSSYLRRNISSRYLLRAALARAIEGIEGTTCIDKTWGMSTTEDTAHQSPTVFYGVYDNPYPGVGPKSSGTTSTGNDDERSSYDGDYWVRRVYTPFGRINASATVPTLTLEGLAYLPPAIVNDVRAGSRRTRTACWQDLDYEAGRFAYTAVNVSDMFDINRLRANGVRSSAPDARVSLAVACLKDYNPSDDEPTIEVDDSLVSKLDAALDTPPSGRPSGADYFVSLADFNLIAYGCTDFAPFVNFINQGGYYAESTRQRTKNAMFITDTYFPASDAYADTTVDISVGENQPFESFDCENITDVNSDINTGTAGKTAATVADIFTKNLGIGIVSLYDYLDSDSIPCSLCLPSVEATPMIMGVSAPKGLQPAAEVLESKKSTFTGTPAGWSKAIEIQRECKKIGFTSMMGKNKVMLNATCMYPFKRMNLTQRMKSGYKLRVVMKLGFTGENIEISSRIGNNVSPDNSRLPLNNKNIWTKSNQSTCEKGVVTVTAEPKSLTFKADIESAQDAFCDLQNISFSIKDFKMPIFWQIKETGTDPETGRAYSKEYLSLDGIKSDSNPFTPLSQDGVPSGTYWKDMQAANAKFDENADIGAIAEYQFTGQETLRLNAVLWLQIVDSSGEVVDMMPAYSADDENWRDLEQRNATDLILGGQTPFVAFRDTNTFTLNKNLLEEAYQSECDFSSIGAIYAVDPRYNHAPEDLFCDSQAGCTGSRWRQIIGAEGSSSSVFGSGGRDRDVFMFVSDQEYLQSVGELQFLPRITEMDGNQTFLRSYMPNYHGQSISHRTAAMVQQGNFANFTNGGRFWKTYSAYENGDGIDPIYELPVKGEEYTLKYGVEGFRLNPFSQDDHTFFAAVLDTPFDYYVASTNYSQSVNRNKLVAGFKKRSDMAEYTIDEELDDGIAGIIAKAMKRSFTAKGNAGTTDWGSAYEALGWQSVANSMINDENTTFFGEQDAGRLHGVDRKFLYSFWRECFDNRQQLYLLFLRAEPNSTGSGACGSGASSQLGGCAVALVWRDPDAPKYGTSSREGARNANSSTWANQRTGSPPHRTRVLFYHQFE